MRIKLSEIFVPHRDQSSYTWEELLALDLCPSFISMMADHFFLMYLENTQSEGDLCFSQDKNLLFPYRMTFSKQDVMKHIMKSCPDGRVNLKRDEVIFTETFFL